MVILLSFLCTIGVFVLAAGLIAILIAIVALDIMVCVMIVRRIFSRNPR